MLFSVPKVDHFRNGPTKAKTPPSAYAESSVFLSNAPKSMLWLYKNVQCGWGHPHCTFST